MTTETRAAFPADLAGSRDFAYIRPRGRKLTEYEAVTCYIQPSTWGGGLQLGGDFFLRPDGRPVFDPDLSAVKVADWFAFRDPNQTWQRPYYVEQARAERFLDGATETFLGTGAFETVEPAWLEHGLGEAYLAFAHAEYGLFRALNTVVREAPSDTVTNCVLFNAADKLRHAQAISLLGLDLEGALEGFDGSAGRRTWLETTAWQPVRRLVEELMVTKDWCEVIVAVNGVFEPLIADPLRQILFSAGAARHGDTLTPVVVGTATRDWQRNSSWARAFFRFIVDEGEQANSAAIAGWLDRWTFRASSAADALFGFLGASLNVPGLPDATGTGPRRQAAIITAAVDRETGEEPPKEDEQ